MPKILVDNIEVYYELHGQGWPLVFIHGAWMSSKMWKEQIEYFSDKYQVLVYDVRCHGRTGKSGKSKYSMELYAEDLKKLLDQLHIQKPIICGLSMGGMIAQSYAAKYPEHMSALILSDTAVSTELTLNDKIIKYILAPKWMFILIVRLLGTKRYADFAFWYSRVTRSKDWAARDEVIQRYIQDEMTDFEVDEFNRIFAALYDFTLQDLSKITVPTLIINGQHESKSVFKHAEKMKELIPDTASVIIQGAGHVPNLEKPAEFNQVMEEFLTERV